MLRHEESGDDLVRPANTVGTETPAGQVRVTAEEFARAVARYQARRDEAARQLEGTVTLGEAVRELGLEATPEEILAEVEAGRTVATATVRTVTPRRAHRVLPWVSGALLVLLGGALLKLDGSHPALRTTDTPATVSAPAPPTSLTITAPGTILVQDSAGKTPVLKTLDEVGNDRPVRGSLLQTGSRATFGDFSNPALDWTLIKHDGRLYVRGWMANMSPQAMQRAPVHLYNHKELVDSGLMPIPVTLPLDHFTCDPISGDDGMLLIRNLRTDGHFRESW